MNRIHVNTLWIPSIALTLGVDDRIEVRTLVMLVPTQPIQVCESTDL